MRLRNFLELVSADAEEARQRGVDQIVHYADHLAKRKGDLIFTVDWIDRETFDEVDALEVPDGRDPAWTKTLKFPKSQYGVVLVIFHTAEPPVGNSWFPNQPEDDGA